MTTPSTALSFEFDAVSSAKKEHVCISISTFELVGVKEEEEKREYFGADGFQALILTLFYLRFLLVRLRQKGYSICDPESGDPFYPETYFDVFSKSA
jgi:hypothetical protein